MTYLLSRLSAVCSFDVTKVDQETTEKISMLPSSHKVVIATALLLNNYTLYFTAGTPGRHFAFSLNMIEQVKSRVERLGKSLDIIEDYNDGLQELPWAVGARVRLRGFTVAELLLKKC